MIIYPIILCSSMCNYCIMNSNMMSNYSFQYYLISFIYLPLQVLYFLIQYQLNLQAIPFSHYDQGQIETHLYSYMFKFIFIT